MIMNTIIENKIKEKRGKVWIMLLDLKVAFGKVIRKIIFKKRHWNPRKYVKIN